ncbi:MAG: hypothetical protein BGO67_12705 [Alphaproteobacteria bacterium 41-28]|mgnify:CR=1 FL=1|nr:MAG: hypothetical protein BGO67_12705 [Alphaproteobacteria bacterium 41-28]
MHSLKIFSSFLALLSVLTVNVLAMEEEPKRLFLPKSQPKIGQDNGMVDFLENFSSLVRAAADGSNAIVPDPSCERVKSAFTKALKKANLFTYAKRLPQFISDEMASRKMQMNSDKELIERELKDLINPSEGFMSDYYPDNKFRKKRLEQCYFLVSSNLLAMDGERFHHTQLKFTYTSPYRLLEEFFKYVGLLKITIKSAEEHWEVFQKNYKSQEAASECCQPEAIKKGQSSITDPYLAEFHITFFLTLLKAEEDDCILGLFSPLINVLTNDEYLKREMKKDEKSRNILPNALLFKKQLEEQKQKLKHLRNAYENLFQPKEVEISEQKIEGKNSASKVRKKKIRGHGPHFPRMERSIQPKPAPVSPSKINDEDNYLEKWVTYDWTSPLQTQQANLKSLYRDHSEEKSNKEKKKLEKKEKLKDKEEKKRTPEEEKKRVEKEEKSLIPSQLVLPGNAFYLFEEIMKKTYNGEMGPVESLIIKHFGGKAHLRKGRWHFGVPHILELDSIVFASSLEPLAEEEGEENSVLISEEKGENPSSIKTTVHNPHKQGSKRLRSHHVKTIKKMFKKGGYTLETVVSKKVI